MSTLRFFGGKGGVGKTTMAAAHALRSRADGQTTLVVSTDPAHSLGDVLDTDLEDEPRELEPGLWAAEISGEQQASKRVASIVADAEHAVPADVMPAVQRHLDRAVASPGTVESALLDRLTELIEQVPDRWDRLVVDSAPTGHMLRLLSLPALLTPWIEGLMRQRQQSSKVEAMAAGVLGHPREQPDPLLDRLHARRERLDRVRERLLADAAVHLVTVPERLVFAETVRAATTLTEAEMPLAPLVVNRVLPTGEGELTTSRRHHEEEVLADIRSRFAEIGVVEVPLQPGTLTTRAELRELASVLPA